MIQVTRNTSWAVIKFDVDGLHQCPTNVVTTHDFIKNEHRHKFFFTIYIKQKHDNRDIEYLQERMQIKNFLSTLYNKKYDCFNFHKDSCEMIARKLKNKMKQVLKRQIHVQVMEDNENGALV